MGRDDHQGDLPVLEAPLLGRDAVHDEIVDILRDDITRCVTLTGPGGVGKTTLAISVAWTLTTEATEDAAPAFDEACWVPLPVELGADADEPDAVYQRLVEEVARAVGIHADNGASDLLTLVTTRLRQAHALLLLDNCEHITPLVERLIKHLLKTCPHLKVLATSQHALSVPGYTLPLDPLPVPAVDEPDTETPAVRLLVEGVRQRRPFEPSPGDLPALVAIARAVGGIPRFLLLAGRLMAALTPREMVEWLSRRPDGVRALRGADSWSAHTTVETTLTWMWDLLGPREQVAAARLAVCPAAFDLPAAQALLGLEGVELYELLQGLVEKSILQRHEVDGRARWSMHAPLRTQGLRALADPGEVHAVHLQHYVASAAEDARRWPGPDELEILRRWRRDQPNVDAALRWAVEHDPQAGLQLLLNLVAVRSPIFDGRLKATQEWVVRLRDAIPAGRRDPALMATATAISGWLLACLGHASTAAAEIDAAEALAQGKPVPAVLFARAAWRWLAHGVREDAWPAFELAAAAFRDMGDAGGEHMVKMFWGLSAAMSPTEQAGAIVEDYAADAAAAGGEWMVLWAQLATSVHELCLAEATSDPSTREQHLDQVATLVDEVCATAARIGDRWTPAWALIVRAHVWSARGHHRHAAVLLGAAGAEQQNLNEDLSGMAVAHQLSAAVVRAARDALGDDAFEAALEDGRQLGGEALTMPAQFHPDVQISPAEARVLRLLPTGLTFRQIASRLGVSVKTVEKHVHSVRARAGLDSTPEAVAEFAAGLPGAITDPADLPPLPVRP